MTREEAITVIKGLSDNPLFSDEHKQAFNIAIHDIKQRHDWDINNLILINKDNYEPLEQEPKKGHWMGDSYGYICSNCEHCLNDVARSMDYISFSKPKYCPNCGAKMESEG